MKGPTGKQEGNGSIVVWDKYEEYRMETSFALTEAEFYWVSRTCLSAEKLNQLQSTIHYGTDAMPPPPRGGRYTGKGH